MKAKVIKTGEIVDVYHESQHGQVSNIYKESVLVNGRMWSEDELDFCVKANEAPEKIWIDPATDLPKLSGHIDKDSIEYIRADAFIEKVGSFLNKKDDRDSYTIGYIKRHLEEIIKEIGL